MVNGGKTEFYQYQHRNARGTDSSKANITTLTSLAIMGFNMAGGAHKGYLVLHTTLDL